MRLLYFGTYERDYPRNAQVIAALRGAGVEVNERHVSVWEGSTHKWRAGAGAAARLVLAEARLLRRPRDEFDAVIVGYPGHLDLPAARRIADGRPVVFNPLVSLYDTFVEDRRRFGPSSPAGRVLKAIDRRALRAAALVVADTQANASFLARLGGLARDEIEVCFVGAEERLFSPNWEPEQPFEALFVGKLIPLHGVTTVLGAARAAPEVRFRLIGSGQLEPLLQQRPPNVAHVPWVEYERLPQELHRAGCALGVFGTSEKAGRVIPNKVFQALACGVPVITADTPAARELLVDGDSALLVPPGDAAALAAGVRRFAQDPELARRIAEGGLRAYRARASERVLGERWRTLIEGLLS
ncbi:MAG: glycosyltransferase family 4 protein [Actinobacteria bacterium]|nr:MAG: glycosyltransferase family 4 protein [Actinomycetota bacterium]